MTSLNDMHCHLGFMTNGEQVAVDARDAGTLLFCNTVSPGEWADARKRFAGFQNVIVGFGMHPWWVVGGNGTSDGSEERGESQRAARKQLLERARNRDVCENPQAGLQRADVLSLLEEHEPRIIGEIGLDFGWSHADSYAEQVSMFSAIASWAAGKGGRLLSIHSVRAAAETFEVLENTGAIRSCTCVFHWFTGPSDLLKRAVKAGCLFSCGPRMLATGKGREYVKAIPDKQILLETDAPPEQGVPYSFAELRFELESVAASIAAIKGEGVLDTIAETSKALLNT